AIADVAGYMLEPDSRERPLGPAAHGLAGIRRFAEELPAYVDFADPQWSVRFAYQNVERRGTGGGTFRRLYARFLDRTTEQLSELDPDLADRMHEIADDWTAIGDTLKDASEVDEVSEMEPLLAEAQSAIYDVADREQELYDELLTVVET
uniref:DUF4872 domain-containing protein n=1 Tax=Halovivax sp. TaxID=1935978 RepID=UPI0025BF342A